MGHLRKLWPSLPAPELVFLLVFVLLLVPFPGSALAATLHPPSPPPAYKYLRVGNAEDVSATSRSGFALMGGGKDIDEAFRWLCVRAGGGDFLILRASGAGDYNRYIQSLCRLNS